MKFFKKKHLKFFVTKKKFINNIYMGNYAVCFKNNGNLNFLQYKALVFFLKKRLKFYSKLFIRLNLTLKITKKPIGIRMGKGKGALDVAYIPVQKGQIFFEFGFKNKNKDILNFQNVLLNVEKIKYFNKKVKQIVKLVSLKVPMKLHLYKNFI